MVSLQYLMYKIVHPIPNEVDVKETDVGTAGVEILKPPTGHVLMIKTLHIYNPTTSTAVVKIQNGDEVVLQVPVEPGEDKYITRDILPRKFLTSLKLVSSVDSVKVYGTVEVY